MMALIKAVTYVFLSNSCLRFSKSVRLLGVNLDPYLNLESHVNNLVSECFYHLNKRKSRDLKVAGSVLHVIRSHQKF